MMTQNNKEKWIEQIYADYPDLKSDTLKRHYVEQMVDSYIADEKKFKQMTHELKKNGTDYNQETIPSEIIAITKIEAEEQSTPIVEEIEA